MVDAGLLDAPDDPYPPTLTLALEKVETLRYGENPHQPAARYRRPGTTRGGRAIRGRPCAAPGQDAVVQQRPRRGGGVGASGGRCAARPWSSSSTRTRAARPSDRRSSRPGRRRWRPTRSARSGGSWPLTRPVDAAMAERARSRSSSRSSSPRPSSRRRSRSWPRSPICACSSTRCWPRTSRRGDARARPGSIRTAGGAVPRQGVPDVAAGPGDDLDLCDAPPARATRSSSTWTSPGGWSAA